MIEAICRARQFSDMMSCPSCELQWDTNDPDPPNCPLLSGPAPVNGAFLADMVRCPLCEDKAPERPDCRACDALGLVTRARVEELRRPVRAKPCEPHWVVISTWRWTRDGVPPFLHGTLLSAEVECKRLSLKYPGKRFSVYGSVFSTKLPRAPRFATAAENSNGRA